MSHERISKGHVVDPEKTRPRKKEQQIVHREKKSQRGSYCTYLEKLRFGGQIMEPRRR